MDRPPALIDRLMPAFELRTRHVTLVRAPAATTYDTLRRTDLVAPLVVRVLLAIRVLPARLGRPRTDRPRPRTLGDLLRSGALLGEDPGREIVLGLIGTFWALRQGARRAVDPSTFPSFDEPGFAKAVMSFTVTPVDPARTLLATETRVLCTDAASRMRFRIYWSVIGPFSGLIRIAWLRVIRDAAERTSRNAPGDAKGAIRSARVATEGEGPGTGA